MKARTGKLDVFWEAGSLWMDGRRRDMKAGEGGLIVRLKF